MRWGWTGGRRRRGRVPAVIRRRRRLRRPRPSTYGQLALKFGSQLRISFLPVEKTRRKSRTKKTIYIPQRERRGTIDRIRKTLTRQQLRAQEEFISSRKKPRTDRRIKVSCKNAGKNINCYAFVDRRIPIANRD